VCADFLCIPFGVGYLNKITLCASISEKEPKRRLSGLRQWFFPPKVVSKPVLAAFWFRYTRFARYSTDEHRNLHIGLINLIAVVLEETDL